MGILMIILWFIRVKVFDLYESPKYLVGRGLDQAAVDVVHKVAKYNGTTSNLSVTDLTSLEAKAGHGYESSAEAAMKRNMERFSWGHIKALFRTEKMARSTGLIIWTWGEWPCFLFPSEFLILPPGLKALIGLAFPLYTAFVPYYLATRGTDFGDGSVYLTYRNQVIISVLGLPGSILAGWMVELPRVGRKGALASSTGRPFCSHLRIPLTESGALVVTGVLLFASTTARTSNALLGWNCGYSFTSNIMYGVLYAMTPEVCSLPLLLARPFADGTASI